VYQAQRRILDCAYEAGRLLNHLLGVRLAPLLLSKCRVRNEPLGKLFFGSQHLGRFIQVFLATHIASGSERSVDRGTRSDGVGLRERDFMPVDKVARNVIDVIFAGHDPTIGTVFPHGLLS
jgi:hypothetical protein